MRVRMLVQIAGPRDGVDWPPIGSEIDLPDQEGADMCAVGMAIPVPVDVVETTVAAPVEKRARTRRTKEDDAS